MQTYPIHTTAYVTGALRATLAASAALLVSACAGTPAPAPLPPSAPVAETSPAAPASQAESQPGAPAASHDVERATSEGSFAVEDNRDDSAVAAGTAGSAGMGLLATPDDRNPRARERNDRGRVNADVQVRVNVSDWRRKRLGRAARFAIEPTAGPVGTALNIYGNFKPALARNTELRCTFAGGAVAKPYYISSSRIIMQVPQGARSGPVRCQVGDRRIFSDRFSVTDELADIFVPVDEEQGLLGAVYKIPRNTRRLPNFNRLGEPIATFVAPTLSVAPRRFEVGFPGLAGAGRLDEYFAIRFVGMIESTKSADYTFQLRSDDGARLYINDKLVIDNDGIHPPTAKEGTMFLPEGKHTIVVEYFQGPRYEMALELLWKRGNNPFSAVPARVLSRYTAEFDCMERPIVAWWRALTPECQECERRAAQIMKLWEQQCGQ